MQPVTPPKVAKLNSLAVWAERGLVLYEDTEADVFEKLSVKEALLRIKAINDMLGTSSCDYLFSHSSRRKVQRFVEEVIEVIKQAKEQGVPGTPDVTADRLRRRPKTILVPSSYGF